ncbi:MAG: hypothetical protein RDA78_25715 [Roseibium sp.]|uniref:hypothetical protein n=1 Tax=Roseibium sp. TaxID=1936156 RepID=UPI003D9C2863
MVFGWLKGAVQRKADEVQRAELQHFIAMLRGADDEELGLVVAIATDFRNSLSAPFDLLDPINTVDVSVPLQLVRQYQDLQKRGLQAMAPGVAVWLHTTRAAHAPSNREFAREMWSVLERGMPCAEEAALGFKELTGTNLNCSGFTQIPIGFEPRRPKRVEPTKPTSNQSQNDELEPLREVSKLVFQLGNDITEYGCGVALLSLESGYSVAETASHITVVSFARNVKRAADEANLEATMKLASVGLATSEMLKEMKDSGAIRQEIWENDVNAIMKMMTPSEEAIEYAEKVLSDPVSSKEPVAKSRILFK